MKKKRLIMLMVVILLTAACGKENNELQDLENVYYDFGIPTEESSTDYKDVIEKNGNNAFVKLENGNLSVCIYKDESIECFKSNNYEEEKEHLKTVFGYNNCNAYVAVTNCKYESLNCFADSKAGLVFCNGTTTGSDRYLDSNGHVYNLEKNANDKEFCIIAKNANMYCY